MSEYPIPRFVIDLRGNRFKLDDGEWCLYSDVSKLQDELRRKDDLIATFSPGGEWTYSEQRGTPGHCDVAQIFRDGKSVAYVEPTEDEMDATETARLFSLSPKLLKQRDEYRKMCEKMLNSVIQILCSGIEMDDERIRYKVVQIYHADWNELVSVRSECEELLKANHE